MHALLYTTHIFQCDHTNQSPYASHVSVRETQDREERVNLIQTGPLDQLKGGGVNVALFKVDCL